MNFRHFRILLLIFAVGLVAESARGQHFDIFIARPATGTGTQTVIGGADVDALVFNADTRVFEVELGVLGSEYFALDPGVNHPNLANAVTAYPLSAGGLQPGDTLRLKERDFSVGGNTDDLFYWNGTGTVSFAPSAANFHIEDADPLGETAGTGGAFDYHPFLFVDSIALPGIYLASAYGVVDGFDPSDPIYLVMGTENLITAEFLGISQEEFNMLSDEDLGEALDAVIDPAVEYVEANVAVPEPGSTLLAVLAVGSVLATGHGRRQSRGCLQTRCAL
jgi:hypothetical protein